MKIRLSWNRVLKCNSYWNRDKEEDFYEEFNDDYREKKISVQKKENLNKSLQRVQFVMKRRAGIGMDYMHRLNEMLHVLKKASSLAPVKGTSYCLQCRNIRKINQLIQEFSYFFCWLVILQSIYTKTWNTEQIISERKKWHFGSLKRNLRNKKKLFLFVLHHFIIKTEIWELNGELRKPWAWKTQIFHFNNLGASSIC